LKIQSPPNATPLDDETLRGLIPGLTTQAELDEFEAAGIARATMWAVSSRIMKKDLLTVSGLCTLHKKMFEETWQWAGQFRLKDTNIGVDPRRIQSDLQILLGDVQYWIENKTYQPQEIIARFHHRLVWIHPFPNGNGRFSRLAADLLAAQMQQAKFKWGSENLGKKNSSRDQYISALQLADREEMYQCLIEFMTG
jgi:mobile mystery protein B